MQIKPLALILLVASPAVTWASCPATLDFSVRPLGKPEPVRLCEEYAGKVVLIVTYGVRFPMFEKTHAVQSQADPIYRLLGDTAGEYPRWNFHKYLLDRQGNLVGSYPSQVLPDDPRLVKRIESLL